MTDLMTSDEHKAVQMLGEVWNLLAPTVTTDQDGAELCGHVHTLQHFVMARAAARAYPERYRL